LETYTDRSLTKEEDILNAFAVVITDAAENGLKTFYGLTSLYFAMDLLWLPCRWLARRSGFPSWSWIGWKGPIIMHGNWPDYASALVWTQRASWISFYAFDEEDQKIHLINSSYTPEREMDVQREESREEQLEREQEGLESSADNSRRSKQDDHFKRWDGKTNSGKVLIPLLARLALGGTEARSANRLQSVVEKKPLWL